MADKFRDDEEKEDVMAKLTSKDMSMDMANFFVLVDSVTTEDVFEFHFLRSNPKFFLDVFTYVSSLIRQQGGRAKLTTYVGNVISKMYIDTYYNVNRITKANYNNRDMIMCLFLRDLLIYLNRKEHSSELLFAVNMLISEPTISNDIVLGLLRDNEELNTHFIVEDLAYSFNMDLTGLLQIIYGRFERTTDRELIDLIEIAIRTEEVKMELIQIVLDKYVFEYATRKPRVIAKTKGKERRYWNFIREFLTESMVSSMEGDVWEFINGCTATFSKNGNMLSLSIYDTISVFLASEVRRNSMIKNFNTIGWEDPADLLTDEQRVRLNVDYEMIKYDFELSSLTNFKFFVRLLNMRRFSFLSHDRSMPDKIKLIKPRTKDIGQDMLNIAFSKDTYNLLFNY